MRISETNDQRRRFDRNDFVVAGYRQMIEDFAIAKEPGFWIAIVLALMPIIGGAGVIWWVQQ